MTDSHPQSNDVDAQIEQALQTAGERWRASRERPGMHIDPELFTSRRSAYPSARGVLAPLAGGMALVALLVGLVLVVPPANPPGSASPSLTDAPTTPSPFAFPAWTESRDTGLGQVIEFDGLATSGTNHVLIGATPPFEGLTTEVWHSADFEHWRVSTLPTDGLGGLWGFRQVGVVAFADGFVLLAHDFSGPRGSEATNYAFTSGDGARWALQASFAGNEWGQPVAFDDHLIAFARLDDGEGPAAWITTDAMTWQPVTSASARTVAHGLLAVGATKGRLWAIRSDDPESASADAGTEVWTSSDGVEWSMQSSLPGSHAATSAALGIGPLGFVVTTNRYVRSPESETCPGEVDMNPLAWFSADGDSWQAASSAPYVADQIIGDEIGFVAVGVDSSQACRALEARQRVYASTGLEWLEMGGADWLGREIDWITFSGTQIVGVGIDWHDQPLDSEGGVGIVWSVARASLAP